MPTPENLKRAVLVVEASKKNGTSLVQSIASQLDEDGAASCLGFATGWKRLNSKKALIMRSEHLERQVKRLETENRELKDRHWLKKLKNKIAK